MPSASIVGPLLRIQCCADCVLTAGKDNTLRVVDLRTLKPRLTLRAPGYAVGGVWTGAALGPDEKHAAAGRVTFLNAVFLYAVTASRKPVQAAWLCRGYRHRACRSWHTRQKISFARGIQVLRCPCRLLRRQCVRLGAGQGHGRDGAARQRHLPSAGRSLEPPGDSLTPSACLFGVQMPCTVVAAWCAFV